MGYHLLIVDHWVKLLFIMYQFMKY
jgi:hypothetical protein